MLKVFVALAAVLCISDPQQSEVGRGVLAGRVIDASTTQPLTSASVTLWQTRGGSVRITATTDGNGAFSFGGLTAGNFDITAYPKDYKDYLEGGVGRRRPSGDKVWVTLMPGEQRGDLVIPMFREAVVTGRVVDEQDRPISGFDVDLWPRARHPFGDRGPAIRGARTDSDGMFRLGEIAPGEYVVVAEVLHDTLQETASGASSCGPKMPRAIPMAQGIRLTPNPAIVEPPEPPRRALGTLYSELSRGLRHPKPLADGTPMTYRTTFYPDGSNMATAATITLRPGDVRGGIDFKLRPVVATKVTGRLTSSRTLTAGSHVMLRLADDPRADGADARTWLADEGGAFTLVDVPAGPYILHPVRQAQRCDVIFSDADSALTNVPLDVPENGVEGVVVPLTTSLPVTGTVVVHGSSGPLRDIDVRFRSLDRWSESDGLFGTVSRNGVEIEGAVPGSYELHTFGGNRWWLERVTVGGRDATGQPVVVGAGGLADLVVAMTDRPSSISGTVHTASHQTVDDATVVLFPVDRAMWPNARIGALRFPTNRALRGIYEFPHVLAGDYFIAAVEETTMDAWPAQDFLERLAPSANRIHVETGVAQTVGLTLKR